MFPCFKSAYSKNLSVKRPPAKGICTEYKTVRKPYRREEILHAYQERSSLRGLTRTFGVSRTTVSRVSHHLYTVT